MFKRIIELPDKHSLFLFGPRGTGKSTLLQLLYLDKKKAKQVLYIDLLDDDIFERYIRKPQSLENEIKFINPRPKIIIIDEIQRVPRLLNLVHKMIENDKLIFILTGSSARKIKRGAANLLAGRAFLYSLFPLTSSELATNFDLNEVLRWGALPKIFQLTTDKDKDKFLQSYTRTYLKEEIIAEQVTRKLEPFRDFLEIAAQSNGKIVNYASIARDVGVDIKTVKSYFQILEDTLVGFYLNAYHQSIRKSQRLKPKFYFFDIGVKRSLERTLDIPCNPRTSFYGEAFEHFVILEIFRINCYLEKEFRLSYFQTHDGGEIDLILSKPRRIPILIEIKSSKNINEIEVRSLAKYAREISKESDNFQAFYLSQDTSKQNIDGVRCLPWNVGINEIFKTS
ncbi:MAG: ATP-binding protein [Oligoflexia bacterium]|nr:ATP-binding protein [Oligoflexia bacterium]